MKCKKCKKDSIYKFFCREHFIEYFEKNAKDTIKRFSLLSKKDIIAVAVSGGKDSMSLLYLLHKLGYNITGLAVDEGIAGYRERTLKTLSDFCKENRIKLKIVSFKEHFHKNLDEIIVENKERPCTVCGIFRRYLLNLNAKDFDVLATGHNMDDEAQAIVMNLMKNNLSILQRLGPVSGIRKSKNFTKRVKPFYLTLEKECMIYAFINGLVTDLSECPHVHQSFRLRIRDMLNETELKMPGTKRNTVEWFLKYKSGLHFDKNISEKLCTICGEPSAHEICNACAAVKRINQGI